MPDFSFLSKLKTDSHKKILPPTSNRAELPLLAAALRREDATILTASPVPSSASSRGRHLSSWPSPSSPPAPPPDVVGLPPKLPSSQRRHPRGPTRAITVLLPVRRRPHHPPASADGAGRHAGGPVEAATPPGLPSGPAGTGVGGVGYRASSRPACGPRRPLRTLWGRKCLRGGEGPVLERGEGGHPGGGRRGRQGARRPADDQEEAHPAAVCG